MDTFQSTEQPKKKSLLLKLLIVFLTIAVIGVLAALYIPASIGHRSPPMSGLASLFWFGFLFMALWAHGEKSKTKGFLIGALIGLIFYFFAAILVGYKNAAFRYEIDQAIIYTNQELPIDVQGGTSTIELISVDHESKEYFIHLTIKNWEKDHSGFDEALKSGLNIFYDEALKLDSCKNPFYQKLLSKNYSINFFYKDKLGEAITSYKLKRDEC